MLKDLQWFLDRVGKRVFRDNVIDSEYDKKTSELGIIISNELQAQYMFDIQQDFYHESGINLNYRDEDKKANS